MGRVDDRLRAIRRRHVGLHRQRAPAERIDLRGGGVEWILTARADGEICTFTRQRESDGAADALAPTRDQRDATVEPELHQRGSR